MRPSKAFIVALGVFSLCLSPVRAEDDEAPSWDEPTFEEAPATKKEKAQEDADTEAEARAEAAAEAEAQVELKKLEAEAEAQAKAEAEARKAEEKAEAEAAAEAAKEADARAAKEQAEIEAKIAEERAADARRAREEAAREEAARKAEEAELAMAEGEPPPSETLEEEGLEGYERFRSPLNFGLDFSYSYTQFVNYTYDGAGTTAHKKGHFGHVTFEWMPLTRAGKLGIGLGLGFFTLNNVEVVAGQTSTLQAFPLDAYLSYRLDFFRHQILVPYGKLGGNVTFVTQKSTTGGLTRDATYGSSSTFFGGGCELSLHWFEPKSSNILDATYGVNDTFLFLEFLSYKAQNVARFPNLTHDELRVGLRLEL